MKKFISYIGAALVGLLVALFVLWTEGSDTIHIVMTAGAGALAGLGYVYLARLAKVDEATMSNWAGVITFVVAMAYTLFNV